MFKEIRLKDRATKNEKTIEIIEKGSFCVLSTIGDDGYPYGVPLNYTYFDNCICFHCAQEGHKIENINFNNKVSFRVRIVSYNPRLFFRLRIQLKIVEKALSASSRTNMGGNSNASKTDL